VKKIGIVGGVAWQSTMHYYAELCRRSERYLASRPPGVPSTPEISIESLDHAKAVSYIGSDGDEESWVQFDEYHRLALKRLEASGVDFALIASNTPHHRFDTIVRGIGIPVISILEVAAKESARIGAQQVLLLGTALTMSSSKVRQEFARHGVAAISPTDGTARSMTIKLIADLQLGKLEGASERLGRIAKRSFGSQASNPPAVCLACTELPLAFERMKRLATFEHDGILFLNTTVMHINAAFNFALDQ